MSSGCSIIFDNNFDNISSNSRNTNSFGEINDDLLQEFYEIPDEFSFQ